MKARFYSIKDLYDEVKNFPDKVVRMQFLEKHTSQEFKAGMKTAGSLPMIEYRCLITVAPAKDIKADASLYYYDQPYFFCLEYEAQEKAAANEKLVNEIKDFVNTTFQGWAIKQGAYEE